MHKSLNMCFAFRYTEYNFVCIFHVPKNFPKTVGPLLILGLQYIKQIGH
jgi:hypothetical protein